MRVVPRRSKDRQDRGDVAPDGAATPPAEPEKAPSAPDAGPPAAPKAHKSKTRRRSKAEPAEAKPDEAKPDEAKPAEVKTAEAKPAEVKAAAAEPEKAEAASGKGKKAGFRERRKARKAARGKIVELDKATEPVSLEKKDEPVDEAARRRARAVERQRAAAQLKQDRAAYRKGRVRSSRREAAAREHRAAMLTMILTLGLLIAAVAVTGGMIAASMRTKPVALVAPLHIYPVAQTTPGACPTGTQGISGQASTGPTCYHLNQGIAIRQVNDLKVQQTRGGAGFDVAVTLRGPDRKAFAQLTRAMIGRDLAFVVRDRLVTAPRVEVAITDGKIVINGPQTRADADRIVNELRGR